MVLCEGPIGHNKSSNHKENIACDSLCGNIETQPLINLSCVVCTCHNIEKKTTWNLISSISIRAAQIPQQDMAIEVTDLTKHSKPKADLHLEVTNRGV